MPTSIEPAIIWFAICCTARRPDEQNRLAIEAAVVSGKPAARTAERAAYAAAGLRTLPTQTSSTRLGSRLDFSRTVFIFHQFQLIPSIHTVSTQRTNR